MEWVKNFIWRPSRTEPSASDETIEKQDKNTFDTLCVVEFSPGVSADLVQYLENAINLPKTEGGAGLKCLRCLNIEKQYVFHIGCSFQRLLEIADYVNMKKRCTDGTLQMFCVNKLEQFENAESPSEFFSRSEKQRLVLHELENIKASSTDFVLPGYKNVKCHHGSSIIKKCIHHNVISQIFPLHDSSLMPLAEMWYKWSSLLSKQPIGAIKKYYGESIGMYFSFLDYYSSSLMIPSLVGLTYYIFRLHKDNIYSLILFAVFNIIWSTAFLEGWKRKSSALAYSWGMTDIKIREEARPNYHGVIQNNPVTNKLEPHYPKWKRRLRFYCVSLPIVLLCLLTSLAAMFCYFWAENLTAEWYLAVSEPHLGHEIVSFVPTIIYSVAIIVMNNLYRPLATRLNEWENHRLQSSFDNHLICKLVWFWFINTFIAMFYVAFYLQDIVALRKTLLTELIVTQAVDQLQETVLPYIMYKWRKQSKKSMGDIYESVTVDGVVLSAKGRGEVEAAKDVYEGTFDDFLELFIQFGYVVLFSCVFPLAACLAYINNLTELRTDALKLCRIYQRPFSKPSAGIGAWQWVFDAMGYLAVTTNCALIGLSARKAVLLPNYSDFELVLLVVVLERALVMLKVLLAHLIPDQPRWVQIALARDEYQLKTADLSAQIAAHQAKKQN